MSLWEWAVTIEVIDVFEYKPGFCFTTGITDVRIAINRNSRLASCAEVSLCCNDTSCSTHAETGSMRRILRFLCKSLLYLFPVQLQRLEMNRTKCPIPQIPPESEVSDVKYGHVFHGFWMSMQDLWRGKNSLEANAKKSLVCIMTTISWNMPREGL